MAASFQLANFRFIEILHIEWFASAYLQLKVERHFSHKAGKGVGRVSGNNLPAVGVVTEPRGENYVSTQQDRAYHFWERRPYKATMYNRKVAEQKLDYIHYNPVKAGLCEFAVDYKYSSARYYELNEDDWGFITLCRASMKWAVVMGSGLLVGDNTDLRQNEFWQIEWRFKNCEPSQPLRNLLEQAGITIVIVP